MHEFNSACNSVRYAIQRMNFTGMQDLWMKGSKTFRSYVRNPCATDKPITKCAIVGFSTLASGIQRPRRNFPTQDGNVAIIPFNDKIFLNHKLFYITYHRRSKKNTMPYHNSNSYLTSTPMK